MFIPRKGIRRGLTVPGSAAPWSEGQHFSERVFLLCCYVAEWFLHLLLPGTSKNLQSAVKKLLDFMEQEHCNIISLKVARL